MREGITYILSSLIGRVHTQHDPYALNGEFNPLMCILFRQKYKHVFTISIIPQHWQDTGSWDPSLCDTRSYLFYIFDAMAADDLAT